MTDFIEPKGREWLLALCNKPSTQRNGPDIVAMNRAINWLYDELENLISEKIKGDTNDIHS